MQVNVAARIKCNFLSWESECVGKKIIKDNLNDHTTKDNQTYTKPILEQIDMSNKGMSVSNNFYKKYTLCSN